MELLNRKLLYDFKQKYADARSDIDSWEAEVEGARWNTPHDIRNRYPKAHILKDRQVVFEICWNRYRLLVQVAYNSGKVMIKKIGTHKEYDNWNLD